MRLKILTALTIMPLATSVALLAQTNSFPPLKRTPLIDQTLPPSSVREIKGGEVVFAPGQPTGRHFHPVPVVGIVTRGSFIFQPHGQQQRILHTGDAFYEAANVPTERFDNASATEDAAIRAFYLIDKPGTPLIVMLPAN
jgi:quercetin dioxygenase-like cupin family protein